MIEWFATSVVKNRAGWTAVVLALLGGAVLAGSRLRIRNEASDFLPRGSESLDSVERAIRARLGGADQIVVLVERFDSTGERPRHRVAETTSALVDSIALDLSRIPGIRQVQYRISSAQRSFLEREAARHYLALVDTFQLAGLRQRISPDAIRRSLSRDTGRAPTPIANLLGMPAADPLGVLAPAAGTLERGLGGGLIRLRDGYFVLPGSETYLLLLLPDRSLGDLTRARVLTQRINAVLASRTSPGLRTIAVGRAFSFLRSIDTTIGDGTRIALAAAIVSFGLLWVFFRKVAAPLLLIGVVGYGLALTGGLVALLTDGIGVVAWLFVALLVGLGDEFAFYIASHYWISGEPGLSREHNLMGALRRPARGLVVSGLAMAFAFLALLVVSYPIMVQLAWITALGLLALMAAAFVVLPVGLAYTEPGNRIDLGAWRWVARGYQALARFPRLSLAAWLGFLLVAGWLGSGVSVELHPWKVALRDNPATGEMEQVRSRLRFWPSPLLMVSQADTPEEALGKDRAAVGALDVVGSRAGVVWVESLSRLIADSVSQQASIAYVRRHREDFTPERFQRAYLRAGGEAGYASLVGRLLDPDPTPLTVHRLRELGLDSLVSRHLIRAEEGYLAVSYLYLEQFPWARGAMPRFEAAIHLGGFPALQQARFVGDAVRGSLHAERLRKESLRATLLAFGLVGLLLAIHFRRAAPVLLCLVPLVFAIAGSLAVMRVMGIELNVLTLGVAPILVGLCVDDGIHIVEGLEQGRSPQEVLRHSGAAMIVTTLTTIGAAACLGLASFASVRELGLVLSAGLVVALLASLHLVPLGYRLAAQRGD